jgi:uncharacterized membrane protein (DUF373 family)
MIDKWIHKAENFIFYTLTGVAFVYIAVELIELFYQFGKAIFSGHDDPERILITKDQTRQVLPVFFNILIAVELVDTFRTYVNDHSIKVQSILLIGLIAIGRKLLVLDFSHADGISNLGLAALILSLSGGYWLVKKADRFKKKS